MIDNIELAKLNALQNALRNELRSTTQYPGDLISVFRQLLNVCSISACL